MQQIYKRTSICQNVVSINLLCKLFCNLIGIPLRHACSPVNWLHVFRTPFPKSSSGRLLLEYPKVWLTSLLLTATNLVYFEVYFEVYRSQSNVYGVIFFCEKTLKLKAVYIFHKKAPSSIINVWQCSSQKHPSRGVFRKRRFENMQQIYSTPMPKSDFNNGCSPVNFVHIFRTPFTKNTSERLLLLSVPKYERSFKFRKIQLIT